MTNQLVRKAADGWSLSVAETRVTKEKWPRAQCRTSASERTHGGSCQQKRSWGIGVNDPVEDKINFLYYEGQQNVERMSKNRNASERGCWSCRRRGHVAVQCPNPFGVESKRQRNKAKCWHCRFHGWFPRKQGRRGTASTTGDPS